MPLTDAARPRRAVRDAGRLTPRRAMAWIGLVVLVGAWVVLLRPQALGGPAAFVMVTGDSMEPSLSAGDLVVATQQEAYAIGDVVVYRVPRGDAAAGRLVIHRIVAAPEGAGYVLRGDNRSSADFWQPGPEEVVGRLQVVLPGGARLVEWLRQPVMVASLATLAWLAFALRNAPTEREDAAVR